MTRRPATGDGPEPLREGPGPSLIYIFGGETDPVLMSVSFDNRRNIGILVGIVAGTIVLAFFGTQWLRDSLGWNLIGELAYTFLVLVLALVAYDRLLVR